MFYNTIDQQSLSNHFQDLTAYNLWSITRLTEWLRQKPGALMEAMAYSSFPGIKATLLHMLEVEREWMGHLEQRPELLQEGVEDDLEMVLDQLVEQAAALHDYVKSLKEEAFEELCPCNLLLAGEITLMRKDIIQHYLHHGTYHRGQVVTIAHQVGLKDAPMTDYLFYCLKVKKGASRPGNHWAAYRATGNTDMRNSFLAVNFFSR